MTLFVLAYLGGVLTILSPCILPVLPFVFARADKPFVKSGLPMLVGMALSFVAVASLAAVAGGWAVQANQYGRWLAMALLALFGLTLVFPALADRLTRPLVAAGGRLSDKAGAEGGVAPALLLGVATGLLWAPCAGPILGLVLTLAAVEGASAHTSALLLAYALGTATSLTLALLVGGRVFAAMKRSLGVGEWVRRVLGVLVLAGVAAIALGLDTGLLTRLSIGGTTRIEQGLLDRLQPAPKSPREDTGDGIADMGPAPPLTGATGWLNSPPLTMEQLRGKVVLIDFWTYSCINCVRSLPYVEAWARRYGPEGLVVIGVHTPEFAFEKIRANVEKAVRDFHVAYPVAMDNDRAIWKAYDNGSWPSHYLIDAKGRLRFQHAGEGEFDKPETAIRKLLAERNGRFPSGPLVGKAGAGLQQAADFSNALSFETWLGYGKAMNFTSPGGIRKDLATDYTAPATYGADAWAVSGRWTFGAEQATSNAPGARLVFRFNARDLNLVLGAAAGKPVRIRVTLDGKPPGADHGVDVDANGMGVVDGQRVYQLVRQQKVGGQPDRTFAVEFLDGTVQAYAFTFG